MSKVDVKLMRKVAALRKNESAHLKKLKQIHVSLENTRHGIRANSSKFAGSLKRLPKKKVKNLFLTWLKKENHDVVLLIWQALPQVMSYQEQEELWVRRVIPYFESLKKKKRRK